MKPTEYPEEDARTVPFQPEKERVIVRRPPDSEAQYVDMPKTAEERKASRNLTWAIVALVLGALAFWMGCYYAGAAAARTLIACLGTFGILWLLANGQVLRQRHGVLLGFALVVLLGAAIPFIEGGARRLDAVARERLANQSEMSPALTVPPPPPTLATAPPAPPTIPLPPMGDDVTNLARTDKKAAGEKSAAAATAPKKPALATKPASDEPGMRELLVPEPDPSAGKVIRLKEDVKVTLDGRPTVIRAGTLAPFKAVSDGQVTFLAGDHEVSIDLDLVTITGASREKPDDIRKMAQMEAMRRYPKLGESDSKENVLYVARVKELQLDPTMKFIFDDPKWPLVLAEQLAEREGWRRADLAEEEAPAKEGNPAIPENEMPAGSENTDPVGKPVPPLTPQQSEPPPLK